jgi:fibronectin-binding protein 1
MNSDATAKAPIVFTNNVTTGSLVVKKTVSGNMGDKTKAFNFSIEFGVNDAFGTDAPLTGTKTKADGTTEDFYFVYNKEQSRYVSEEQLTLSDGESIRIDGIYKGTYYKVTEDEYAGYTCNVTRTKDKVTTYVANNTVSGYIGTGDRSNLEEFTNTNEYTTDTGITTDVIPYVLLALVTAVGLMALAIRRRAWQKGV